MTAKIYLKPERFTTEQYRKALRQLGLTPASRATAYHLGLSVRQCQRVYDGESSVPGPVVKLLAMYLSHGLETRKPTVLKT